MSIRDELSEIPKPADIAVAMQRAAMLDIVFSEEAWLRCFDYQPKWSKNVVMAKYDNGGGNHLFVLFTGKDAVIKGFDHESEVSRHMRDDFAVWPGM